MRRLISSGLGLQAPLMAVIGVAAVILWRGDESAGRPEELGPDAYVVYQGMRFPAAEAAKHMCHTLAYPPEVRCFDTLTEMGDEVSREFPGQSGTLRHLMEMQRDDPASPED